jgi:hypothetical protein
MIKERFSLFVALSLLAHLALFGLVIVLGSEERNAPSRAATRARDLESFREALRVAASDGAVPARLANALIGLSEDEIAEAFRQAPVLDSRLTGQEKAGLYKKMFDEATSQFTEGAGGRSAADEPLSRYFGGLREMPLRDPEGSFELVKIGDALDESARLFRISKETSRELQALVAMSPAPRDRPDQVLVRDKDGRVDAVPGDYFYRHSPYLPMAAVGAEMFYVVKGFPELPALPADEVRSRARPAAPPPSPAFSVVYMPRPRPGEPAPSVTTVRPTLNLRSGDADRILDGLMPLSDIEQVRTFYRDYLSTYDPDSPDLADLASAFVYRNLGMVFILMDNPLSRGFDLLEEAYYDDLSQDELVPFALENAGTRTGTALLLCLAASYEFERRVIEALDGSLGAAKEVLADPSTELYFVHNKNVKAYVLREVYRDLAAELRRRDYSSMRSVLQKYKDKQLEIYDYLVRAGEEARSRALYARGRLYWDEGDIDSALKTWTGVDPALVSGAARGVRQALAGERDRRITLARIDDILSREASLDRIRLFERVKRFRKWTVR